MRAWLKKRKEARPKKADGFLHSTKSRGIKSLSAEERIRVIKARQRRPYELIKDLLDKAGSGKGYLSMRGEEILREAYRLYRPWR